MSQKSGLAVKMLVALALGALTAFLLHTFLKNDYGGLHSEEDQILALCRQEWGGHRAFSNAIEQKLQTEMPTQKAYR